MPSAGFKPVTPGNRAAIDLCPLSQSQWDLLIEPFSCSILPAYFYI